MLLQVRVDATERHTATIVWLHGLGASGYDFEPIVPMLDLPQVRFVFPHAPERPVTVNGGLEMPAWYDITSLDFDDDRASDGDVAASARDIEALVRKEIDAGIPSERVFVVGFSQGAAMALHVALRFEQSLAGVVCLSGYLLQRRETAAQIHEANRAIPILCCHGTDDDLVPCDLGKETYDFLQAKTASKNIRWHDFPIGHEVSPPQIEVIAQWLRERLADDDQSA